MAFTWENKHDELLRAGLQEGWSASLIAEKLSVVFSANFTRNAVLGRIFRLGLSVAGSYTKPKVVKYTKPKAVKQKKKIFNKRVDLTSKKEIISDMIDAGYTWREIGEALGYTGVWVRKHAIAMGIYEANRQHLFSKEEINYIAQAWNESVPVEDIADALNRSYGVIRQKITFLQKNGRVGSRDPSKTRLLRQYGEKALELGATPSEALKAMAAAKAHAMIAARQAATEARNHRHRIALEQMMLNIEKGMERNEAIFLARAEGASLEEIGEKFSLTRERIRQICERYAQKIALQELLYGKDKQNEDRRGET